MSILKHPDLFLLAQLQKKPSYGYQLLQQSTFPATPSTIYYRLHKLHRLGFIEKRIRKGIKSPDRQLYFPTQKGVSYFQQAVNNYQVTSRDRSSQLLNHYFLERERLHQLDAFKPIHAFDTQLRKP